MATRQGPRLLLGAFNAKYIHPSLGLRYIYAQCLALGLDVDMFEGTVKEGPDQLLDRLANGSYTALAMNLSIWNHILMAQVLKRVRQQHPNLYLILGGPEARFLPPNHRVFDQVDFCIRGEGEIELPRLMVQLARSVPRASQACQFVDGKEVQLSQVSWPYPHYSDEDLAHRFTYVESSRGCPFGCEFCHSSMDRGVRSFPLDGFLDQMGQLIARGAHRFKMVDRSFNAQPKFASEILRFFAQRLPAHGFLQVEMIPATIPDKLAAAIKDFGPATLRVELGVQTFDPQVGARISRTIDSTSVAKNLNDFNRWGVEVHADLIAGLPGESLDSFGRGFDRLYRLAPKEIQLGVLKGLPGTPILRWNHEYEMVYDPQPPYQLLSNSLLTREQLEQLVAFGRLWELYVNKGNYSGQIEALWRDKPSIFWQFWHFTSYVLGRYGRSWGLDQRDAQKALLDFISWDRGVFLHN